MPAPSPITNPSRRASNGRDSPVGLIASSALKPASDSGVIAASAPPVTIASAAPPRSNASAVPIAWAAAAHALTVPNTGPVSP